MEFNLKVLEGLKLEAKLGEQTIISDQSIEHGGTGTAPNPFEYFMASVGLCALHYMNSFCIQRELSTKGLEITQSVTRNSDGKLNFKFKVTLPNDFPEKYKNTILKAAESCTVKKAIKDQPTFEMELA